MKKAPEVLKCPDCGKPMKRASHSKRITYECPTESCVVISAYYDKSGKLRVYRMPL